MANTFTWDSREGSWRINVEELFGALGVGFNDEGELTQNGHHLSGDYEDVLLFVYACGQDEGGLLRIIDYSAECNLVQCEHPLMSREGCEQNLLMFFFDQIASLFTGGKQTYHSDPLCELNYPLFRLFIDSRYTD